MGPMTSGACRAVAALLARYDDPDLSERERVLLSTHLLRCPACLARLNAYRAQDRRLRTMQAATLAPRARDALLGRIASGAVNPGGGGVLTWRQGMPGATFVVTVAAVLLVASLTSYRMLGHFDSPTAAASADAIFTRPLTTTFLAANPTSAIKSVGESIGAAAVPAPERSAQLAGSRGTIRAVYPAEGRIVVTDDSGTDERLVVASDTLIVLADGRLGTLADLVPGAIVRVQHGQGPATAIVRELLVLR